MRIALMRGVDRYAGVPLCWIVGMILHFRRRSSRPDSNANAGRILVIKFFGLGSVLLTAGPLLAVKKNRPGLNVTYLTFAQNKELVDRLHIADELLTIDASNPLRFIRDTVAVLRRLGQQPVDEVYDLEFFSKFSTLLSGLSGARKRAGFSLPAMWRKLIVTHGVGISKNEHVVMAFQRLLGVIGSGRPELESPSITEEDRRSIERKLPLNGKPVVVVNVNSGETFLERRWPADRFAALVSKLASEGGTEFYFIGTESERAYVQSVIDQSNALQHCFNVAGLLSLPELFVLIERAELVISNDSGPLHLAAAFGTPVIGLFGPETPVFYGPLGDRATSVYRAISCSPCMNIYAAKDFRCPYDARCMKQIDVPDVVRLAEEVLTTQ